MANPNCTLLNGSKMPLLGFGTWLSEPKVVGESVKKALEIGYRHIDCAHAYGNEAEVGKAFTEFFSSGEVKREEVFIVSKLWVTDFGNVREAAKLTLKNLQVEYLDLYLIHLPFETNGECVIGYKSERIHEVWKELEALVKDGKLKAIGVSNFSSLKVKNLLQCPIDVKIACNQVELHPYCPQFGLVDFCNEKYIKMVAFGPLGNPGRPEMFKKDDDPHLLDDPVVKSIGEKYKATPAQVLIAYGLRRNYGVLVKSVNESRIKENFEALKVELDTDDMAALNAIKKRFRFCTQSWAVKPDEKPEDLWDGEYTG